VASGRELRTLKGHSNRVESVAFSADGKTLASGSGDTYLKLWDMSNGRELASLVVLDKNDWLVVTPEGLFDGTAPSWKQILWRFNNNTFEHAPVEAYFNDFFHPGLLEEIFRGERPKPLEGNELAKHDRRRPAVTIEQVKAVDNSSTGVSSKNSTSTGNRNITVRVELTENIDKPADLSQPKSGGAQDVRLFRNGSLVKLWRGDVFDQQSGCVQIDYENAATDPHFTGAHPRRAVCTATVPIVAGYNEFVAYAFNHDNLKSDDSQTLVVTGDKSLERKGTLYILAIGINNYKDRLRFAVADVDEASKEIKAQQERLGNYITEIISLTDDLATKSNIMLGLRRFGEGQQLSVPNDAPQKLKQEIEKIKNIQPEDALAVYYAGHGTAIGERFYLLPYDFTGESEEQLKASSISDVELNEILESVGVGKLLMVIDACRSGQALGREKEGRGPMNSKGLAQLAYDKGMYILTAAQSFQAAKEVSRTQTGKKVEHGLLTFALLEGLSKAKKDIEGKINERDWMNYAVAQVPLMQIEEMKKRSAQIKQQSGQGQNSGAGQRGTELVFVEGDKEVDPEKRNVQRPRVFYRRELEARALIVARP
jgi:WD40 domain-containing protein/caspase domain-containing protein